MPRHGLLLLRRMGAVREDVRRSAFGVRHSAAFSVQRSAFSGGPVRSSANLSAGHNQKLKMEMTKKEVREQGKEVKRPEIDPAKNRIILYTTKTPRF
jgi:hypothetical protein